MYFRTPRQHHRIGLEAGTGPLDYESRDPVPDPETLHFKYFFDKLSIYLKKKQKTKNKTKQNKTTNKQTNEKHGSLVVSAHTGLSARMSGLIPAAGEETFWCPNMLSLVSFAGMTLNKCAVLWI